MENCTPLEKAWFVLGSIVCELIKRGSEEARKEFRELDANKDKIEAYMTFFARIRYLVYDYEDLNELFTIVAKFSLLEKIEEKNPLDLLFFLVLGYMPYSELQYAFSEILEEGRTILR